MKQATIVGAGLVGSLWATYLAKAGYQVTIFESRSDLRKLQLTAGKSINLALSNRGWKALETVGIADEVRKIAIPMYGRTMHDLEGNLTFQPYGKENEAIFSTSRAHLNCILMDFAEQKAQTKIHFNQQCIDFDSNKNCLTFKNTETGEITQHTSDLVFGCDGAFSAVRFFGLQRTDRFGFQQNFIADGYREILLPANEDGTHKLAKNTLHIWPRGRFMLIALPNEDGSYTCTLFMPHEGGENAFDKVNTKEEVTAFFQKTFPDFYALMPQIADEWENHPLSSLCIMKCSKYHYKKTVLMGDAAHATVPFYGQGMNAGFEDCTVMWQLMQKHNENWEAIFEEYSQLRKPDGDALQELSLFNYLVMRDFVADEQFLLRKKIEAKFSLLYPNKWMPLYSQVTFSEIRYSDAHAAGERQSQIMDEIMLIPNIEAKWDSQEVMDKILSLVG